ncbi:MAG: isoamylase early set domain-containing protein [Syntrophorhabdaceae bacterium]
MADNETKKRILFKLNNPDASAVYIAGSFNSWDPSVRPLKKDGKGIWKTTITLPQGAHQYRFIVDGEWIEDPASPHKEMNEFGSFNSIVII